MLLGLGVMGSIIWVGSDGEEEVVLGKVEGRRV